jgi:hypothetical protein
MGLVRQTIPRQMAQPFTPLERFSQIQRGLDALAYGGDVYPSPLVKESKGEGGEGDALRVTTERPPPSH